MQTTRTGPAQRLPSSTRRRSLSLLRAQRRRVGARRTKPNRARPNAIANAGTSRVPDRSNPATPPAGRLAPRRRKPAAGRGSVIHDYGRGSHVDRRRRIPRYTRRGERGEDTFRRSAVPPRGPRRRARR